MNYEEKIIKELREIYPILQDPDVTDVILNADGFVWVYRSGAEKEVLDLRFAPGDTLRLLGSIAAYSRTVVTAESPILQAALPWGQRFQGMIPPVTSAPVFAIRCHSKRIFYLEDYVPNRMPETVASELRRALKKRRNIIISGGTGSGKTTLTAALLAELAKICPDDRICIMEDTRELRCWHKDVVFELAAGNTTMRDLLAANLRMRPDRIILGEVRGGEALDLLKSWNTGHPGGISTIHANSAKSALARFEQLVLEAQELHIGYLRSLIADAVDLVVQIERRPGKGPQVIDLIAVDGLDTAKEYRIHRLYHDSEED